jgi:LytS/YehU family sensor histidine kinase
MLSIDFELAPTVRHFSVAPLLLMPLVENAFKFVSSYTDRDNQVRIGLYFSPPEFRFEITNTVDVSPADDHREDSTLTRSSGTGMTGGIGLENVRRRLELLYPNRHVLQIEAAREYYAVSLKIQLV